MSLTETMMARWEQQVANLWLAIDEHTPESFLSGMGALTGQLEPGNPIASFEMASAYDSMGHPERAVPLYREALAAGLTGEPRRRATIQLASSLRNLGEADESVKLLSAERERCSDGLDDAVAAFLALALVDTGQAREALWLALDALSRHLPRYNRSLKNYAADLKAPE